MNSEYVLTSEASLVASVSSSQSSFRCSVMRVPRGSLSAQRGDSRVSTHAQRRRHATQPARTGRLAHGVLRGAQRRLPLPGGAVVVALGGHGDAVGNQEGGVEAHAEAADEVAVCAHLAGGGSLLLHSLHELGGAAAGDGAQRVHQLLLRHADAGVCGQAPSDLHAQSGVCPRPARTLNDQRAGVLVALDADGQVAGRRKRVLVRHAALGGTRRACQHCGRKRAPETTPPHLTKRILSSASDALLTSSRRNTCSRGSRGARRSAHRARRSAHRVAPAASSRRRARGCCGAPPCCCTGC